MDPSRNHRVYRLSVSKMQPPMIPFMPLAIKDMTFTHEGNKTYFDGLVNFEKMVRTVDHRLFTHLGSQPDISSFKSNLKTYIPLQSSLPLIFSWFYIAQ